MKKTAFDRKEISISAICCWACECSDNFQVLESAAWSSIRQSCTMWFRENETQNEKQSKHCFVNIFCGKRWICLQVPLLLTHISNMFKDTLQLPFFPTFQVCLSTAGLFLLPETERNQTISKRRVHLLFKHFRCSICSQLLSF